MSKKQRTDNDLEKLDVIDSASDMRPTSEEELGRFKNRLKDAIGNLSIRAFADKCGLSEGVLRSYLRGDTYPTLDRLLAISMAAGIQMTDLVGGADPVAYPQQDKDLNPAQMWEKAHRPHGENGRSDYIYLPLLDVRASAGGGSLVGAEHILDVLAFKREWICQGLHASPDNLYLITVEGDSMEPTLHRGDVIMVDKSISIRDGIFVIRRDEELLVKRIQRSIGGGITLVSDNRAYREECLTPDQLKDSDVEIVGKVVWAAKMM